MAAADHHHPGHEPYSTLEVYDMNASARQDAHKEFVPHPESQYPQVADPREASKYDSTKPEVVDNNNSNTGGIGTGTGTGNNDDKEVGIAAAAAATTNKGRRICGLSPRLFFLILGIAILVIIGAIVGGVVGSRSKKGQSSDSSSSSQDPATGEENTTILSTSKLAASNWTDPQGVSHRSVFFQDPANAIIARQWESQNRTWTTRNISALLSTSTRGPIAPIPGTSLASASCDRRQASKYEVHLWFSETFNATDRISWVISNSPTTDPDFWVYEPSGLTTWNNTQLAAAWQRCARDECPGTFTVAYQGPSGFIRFANSSGWMNATDPVVRGNAVSAGASLALLPGSRNETLFDGLTLASQRRPGSMEISAFEGDARWKEYDGTLLENLDPAQTVQFAATTMNEWSSALYVSLLRDGSLRAARTDGGNNTSSSEITDITFAGGEQQSTNFSAIAMTTDAMFYGIADGQIWEYAVDEADPRTFTLVGKVWPE